QAEGALGRIGIALEAAGHFPLAELGGTRGGRLGAAEIGNAASQREGKSAGAPALEPGPHALPDRLLAARRRSGDFHRSEEFTMWPMSSPTTIDVLPTHRFDVGALERYLVERIAGLRGPLTVRQFQGGQSNPTYYVNAPGGEYVVRRKPPGKLLPSAHAVDPPYPVIPAL